MKINISSIKDKKGVSLEESFQFKPQLNTANGSMISPQLNITAKITNVGYRFLVEAAVKGEVEVKCDRCLHDFTYFFDFKFMENYADHLSQQDHDEEICLFSGDIIDITENVNAALILNLPLRFLCKENCPGLCPQCGYDFSQGKCDCKSDNINPAFIGLKKLLKPDEEV